MIILGEPYLIFGGARVVVVARMETRSRVLDFCTVVSLFSIQSIYKYNLLKHLCFSYWNYLFIYIYYSCSVREWFWWCWYISEATIVATLAEPQFSASSYILEALIDKPSFYGYVNIVDYSYFSFTLIIVYDDIYLHLHLWGTWPVSWRDGYGGFSHRGFTVLDLQLFNTNVSLFVNSKYLSRLC